MPKLKYDVSDVEQAVFEQPKPGLYPCKVEALEPGKSKAGNDQLTCQFRVKNGDFKGALLWHYVPLDPEAAGYFRMAELIKALGQKAKGTLDTDKHLGDDVQIRVKADSYNGEYRARVGSVLPGAGEDEDDEDLSEDDEEKGTDEKVNGVAEAGEEEDDSVDDDDDYDEWQVDELKAELKERGLRTAGGKAVLIKRLRKDDEDEDDPFS